MFYIYILQSLKDNTYYIGHTSNLKEWLKRHNQVKARYTKAGFHEKRKRKKILKVV